jgi:hypothetical protein
VPVFSSSPGKTAEPSAVHFRAGGDRDGIRIESLHCGRNVVQAAVYRHARHLIAFTRPGHARADYRQPVVSVPPELFDQISHRRLMPDGDHVVQALASYTPPVQLLAHRIPGEEIEYRDAVQGDDHVAAG